MYCYSSIQSKHQKTLKLIVGNLFFKTFLEWCRGQPGTDLRKELMTWKRRGAEEMGLEKGLRMGLRKKMRKGHMKRG